MDGSDVALIERREITKDDRNLQTTTYHNRVAQICALAQADRLAVATQRKVGRVFPGVMGGGRQLDTIDKSLRESSYLIL